jgi:hypothetical protein
MSMRFAAQLARCLDASPELTHEPTASTRGSVE